MSMRSLCLNINGDASLNITSKAIDYIITVCRVQLKSFKGMMNELSNDKDSLSEDNFVLHTYFSTPYPLILPLDNCWADTSYLMSVLTMAVSSFLLVDILDITDISQPMHTCRHTSNVHTKIAKASDSIEISHDSSHVQPDIHCHKESTMVSNNKKKRLAKLLMTDGYRYIIGIEYTPLNFTDELFQIQTKNEPFVQKKQSITPTLLHSITDTRLLGRALLFNKPQCINQIVFLTNETICLLTPLLPNQLPTISLHERLKLLLQNDWIHRQHHMVQDPMTISIDNKSLNNAISYDETAFDDLLDATFESPRHI